MTPTGKQIVAYIRLFDRWGAVSEEERRVLPGNWEVHDEALERGYLDYAKHGWSLTHEGRTLLQSLKADFTPVKSR